MALWLSFFKDNNLSLGFPDDSVGKESTCNAGNPSLISGSRRSPEGGIGYPLQHLWVSLVAQLVKNPPAMRETWVRSLGWEDPLEKATPTPLILLDSIVNGVAKSWTPLSNFHFSAFIEITVIRGDHFINTTTHRF